MHTIPSLSNPRPTPFLTLAATVAAALFMVQCSGSTTGPTTLGLSGVALSATSAAGGGSGEGTVSLTTAASIGGASISLSSSNPAVATVQTSVTIAEGSSSVTFTIAAVAAGTARITASLNGSSRQSGTFTVTAAPLALASISLSTSSVVGGGPVTGTVTLTAAAPAGGAVVSLSGGDVVTPPPSVTVSAGSASTTFTASTRAVDATTTGTITASYGGVSAAAALSVTGPAVATARFGVSSSNGSDTCSLTTDGSTLNCTFNGSTSTAPGTINTWDWSWGVAGGTTFTQTTTGFELTNPSVNCSLLPPPPLPSGEQSFDFFVTLRIHDSLGNVSEVVTNNSARLLPQGACGF